LSNSISSSSSFSGTPAPGASSPSASRFEAHPAAHLAPPPVPELAAGDATFDTLGLAPALLRAIHDLGHTRPTPIQASAIPAGLSGRDILGCAQTGTGKTAAFALPIIQRLAAVPATRGHTPVRALILSPTRELASQIGESFANYGKYTHLRQAVIFGGVGQNPQVDALRRGVDVLVAAPGRLIDLIGQRLVDLSHVEVLVLDEADRMLDEGFLPAVRRILTMLPRARQTMLFSATMPRDLEPLVRDVLVSPVRVEVTPIASTPDKIEQRIYHVDSKDKRNLLEHLLKQNEIGRALVFTRTKHGANRVAEHLENARIGAMAIHGNKSQNARERALSQFKDGSVKVLVATDIAARGIDVDGITHVVNFDIPVDAESYVHRIGRTARAGRQGVAYSFCSWDERGDLASIERLIRRRVEVVTDHPYVGGTAASAQSGPRDGYGAPRPPLERRPPRRDAPGRAPSRPREEPRQGSGPSPNGHRNAPRGDQQQGSSQGGQGGQGGQRPAQPRDGAPRDHAPRDTRGGYSSHTSTATTTSGPTRRRSFGPKR
jgi:ATP-dependent RNA helicase RhlE